MYIHYGDRRHKECECESEEWRRKKAKDNDGRQASINGFEHEIQCPNIDGKQKQVSHFHSLFEIEDCLTPTTQPLKILIECSSDHLPLQVRTFEIFGASGLCACTRHRNGNTLS